MCVRVRVCVCVCVCMCVCMHMSSKNHTPSGLYAISDHYNPLHVIWCTIIQSRTAALIVPCIPLHVGKHWFPNDYTSLLV